MGLIELIKGNAEELPFENDSFQCYLVFTYFMNYLEQLELKY